MSSSGSGLCGFGCSFKLIYISLGCLACLLHFQNTEDERGRWAAVLTCSVCECKIAWMFVFFSVCRHVWCMYWCSYQIHWHTCDPESHPFSFHCHKEDKLESILKQRTCCQWNVREIWQIVTKCFFSPFYLLWCFVPIFFFCVWLSGKFATDFKQRGTNHSVIFLHKQENSNFFNFLQLSTYQASYGNFFLAFFYFLKGPEIHPVLWIVSILLCFALLFS